MVSGKQMNWEHELEQGREGPEGSMCSMEMEKTEQERGRAASTAQGGGNCRAGRKALHIRAPAICNETWGRVDKVGDAPL